MARKLLEDKQYHYSLDREKHALVAVDDDYNKLFDLRLPLPYPTIGEDISNEEYFASVPESFLPFVFLIMQAGISAMAYYENGKLTRHKVIRKYMVRKKQGKAQLHHLKTKGKSRLGSRIRLQQSKQFFEEINAKIREWDVMEQSNAIVYSCPVRLWPMLFDADPMPPFSKDDKRLRKVPIEVKTPKLEELERVCKSVSRGYLVVHQPMDFAFIEDFLP